MRIRLRCLMCGHQVELADTYEDYDGPIRCWTCSSLLDVSIREGRLRAMRTMRNGEAPDGDRPRGDAPKEDAPKEDALNERALQPSHAE